MPHYVQKLRVGGRVSQPNLAPRDGWFLLFPCLDSGDRSETLLELLNSSRTVIPFILAENNEVLLLTRVNIDWVVVQKGVEPQLIYPPGHAVTSEQRVDLRLIDESHVHAIIQWDSPERVDRLSDFLNRGQMFVAAETEFGTLLVNQLRVRETHVAPSAAGEATTVDRRNHGGMSASDDERRRSA